jgi:NAD(P)-dependent dehydrogenase (short-subunit alcohol dehydrogenase family)
VEAAARWTGRIDVLCNNAAYLGEFHDVPQATGEEWDRCLRVQLLGTNNRTRAVLPCMLRQESGSIVNVVSIQAMAGCPTPVAYTAAKAALLGFTLSAAYDYGKNNIRVNSLCPGPIQTRISPRPGEASYEWQRAQTLLGRVGMPRRRPGGAVSGIRRVVLRDRSHVAGGRRLDSALGNFRIAG